VSESISELVTRPFAVWLRVHRDEVIEILKVRAALDGLAAAEAARMVATEGSAAIAEASAAFATAARESPGDTTQLMRLDNAFHQALAAGSGLPLVAGLLDSLNHSVANPHRMTMSAEGRPEQASHQHDEIVAAVMASDVSAAREAAIRHVESLVDLVRRYDDPT
jgi:GntR family transcriptional repressor for pyruvate dehydrogenase complex